MQVVTIPGAGASLCLLALAACGPVHPQASAPPGQPAPHCATTSEFELSLVSDRHGRPAPLAAAAWFSGHSQGAGFPVPRRSWRLTGRDSGGVTLTSGIVTVHVVLGPDKTWQVDSGRACR